MPTPYLGEIKLVAFKFAPKGWALCQGQLLPINQNQALFALFGTTYGGDGQTTFGLPNLQSRTIVGTGQGTGLSPYSIGQQLGIASVPLQLSQIPAHEHTLNVSSAVGTSASPANAHLATAAAAVGSVYGSGSGTTMPGIQPNAGGAGHENRQPFLALNYIVALQGIFPPRN